ncbi:hypothetical protein ES705_44917 [subsurface metagenome]
MTITPRWPNTPLPKYPHLVGSDIPIWDSWIRTHGHYFRGFDYDVHVGQGLEPDKDHSFELQQMWVSLTQKRIDVVGYRPGEVWLIEVKDRPTTAAIGQALSYKILYERDYGLLSLVVPCLVAGSIEPDIETVLRSFDIRFYDLSDGHHWLVDHSGRAIGSLKP